MSACCAKPRRLPGDRSDGRRWSWRLVLALAALLLSVAGEPYKIEPAGKNDSGFVVKDVGRSVSDPRDAFFVPLAGNPVISGANVYAQASGRRGRRG